MLIGYTGVVEPVVQGLGHGVREDKVDKVPCKGYVLVALQDGQVVGDRALGAVGVEGYLHIDQPGTGSEKIDKSIFGQK